MNTPRLRWSPALQAWCCFDNEFRTCTSTLKLECKRGPSKAFAFWAIKKAEVETQKTLEKARG